MVLADESLPVRLAMLPTKANAQSDSTDVQDVHEAPPEEKIPSPEECCSTLDQHPTEVLGDGYTLLVDVRPRGLASAGPQQLAQSQGRHLVRAGLALPWGTERLSPTEKYTFLDSTRRALQARLRRLASGGAGDVETAGLLALLVAFHTGADVREALDIRPAAQVGDAPGQMALERADDTNWWRKPVFAAPYMGRPVETGASPNCLRETVSSLYLPVGCGTARFLRAYWGASDSRVHAGLVPAAWRDAAVASAQAHLASLEGLARSITLSAIEHALFRDVLAETRRMDLAVHLAGRSVFHSGSTIYYAAPAVADLQNVYRSWCASLPCDEESQSDR